MQLSPLQQMNAIIGMCHKSTLDDWPNILHDLGFYVYWIEHRVTRREDTGNVIDMQVDLVLHSKMHGIILLVECKAASKFKHENEAEETKRQGMKLYRLLRHHEKFLIEHIGAMPAIRADGFYFCNKGHEDEILGLFEQESKLPVVFINKDKITKPSEPRLILDKLEYLILEGIKVNKYPPVSFYPINKDTSLSHCIPIVASSLNILLRNMKIDEITINDIIKDIYKLGYFNKIEDPKEKTQIKDRVRSAMNVLVTRDYEPYLAQKRPVLPEKCDAWVIKKHVKATRPTRKSLDKAANKVIGSMSDEWTKLPLFAANSTNQE